MKRKRPTYVNLPEIDKAIRAHKRNVAAKRRRHGLSPGSDWRVQDGGHYNHKVKAKKASERFDEIAVDYWLHVERLGNREFYGSIGGLTFWWTVGRDGQAVITHAEIRDARFGPGALDYILPQLQRIAEQKPGTVEGRG